MYFQYKGAWYKKTYQKKQIGDKFLQMTCLALAYKVKGNILSQEFRQNKITIQPYFFLKQIKLYNHTFFQTN